MATLTWTGSNGLWTDPTQWATGIVPGSGDVAIFPTGIGTIDVAIVNETIDIDGGTQLSLNNASFDAESHVFFNNGTLFTLADFGTVTNNGTMAYGSGTGEVDLYLIPGTSANFVNNGMFSLSEPSKVLDFGTITNSGTLRLVNLTSTPISLTAMSSAATINNEGSIVVDGSLSFNPSDTTATFNGGISGTGTIDLASGQIFAMGTVASGQAFNFLDAHGALALNLPSATFGATITGFPKGDSIDLGTSQADSVSFAGGVLTISYQSTPEYTLNLSGSYQTSDFGLTPNALTHEVLTTSAVPCFVSGTRISTERGEIAVEELRVGDRVQMALHNKAEPVSWIGHRHVDCARHPAPHKVWPIRILAGAFGPGQPCRDLWLSPDHAVYVDAVLIPAKSLINGRTIAQVPVDSVTYYHVELPEHAVLLAEGLPAESYLDTGDRTNFANGDGPMALFPDFASLMREAAGCLPLIVTGPELLAARRKIQAWVHYRPSIDVMR